MYRARRDARDIPHVASPTRDEDAAFGVAASARPGVALRQDLTPAVVCHQHDAPRSRDERTPSGAVRPRAARGAAAVAHRTPNLWHLPTVRSRLSFRNRAFGAIRALESGLASCCLAFRIGHRRDAVPRAAGETMGSSSKRSAKQAARATAPAASRTRVRAPIRVPGRSKTAKQPVAPAAARAAPAKARPRAAPFPLRAVIEELERRLLMSADIAPIAAEALLALPAPGGAEFRSLVADSTVVAAQRRPDSTQYRARLYRPASAGSRTVARRVDLTVRRGPPF